MECVHFLSSKRRGGGRRQSECEQKELLLQMCPLTPISYSLPTLGEYFQGDLLVPVRPETFLVIRVLCVTCLGKHAAKPQRTKGLKK